MQIGFIIAIVIYIIVLAKTTAPVPNYDNDTGTYHYLEGEPIPPNYVDSTYLTIALVLLAGLVMSFVTKEVRRDLMDIEEARNIVNTYLKDKKSITTDTGDIIEMGDCKIDPNFIPRDEIIKNERRIFEYVLQMTITDSIGNERYVKCRVKCNPPSMGGFTEIDEPLSDKDKCSKCGDEFDVKLVDSEEVKMYKHLKKEIGD